MPTKHILVPYEPSDVSYKAFETALAIAKKNNSAISAIMIFTDNLTQCVGVDHALMQVAIDKMEQNSLFEDFKAMILEAKKHKIKIFTGIGYSTSIQKGIMDYAKKNKVDLIVMGTVARTGIAGFFIGNTAENVLNQVDCSVLTVKPDEFVTPVSLD